MSWSLTPNLSASLLAYYFGPDHVFKQRIWSWLHRAFGSPRFVVPYAQSAKLSLDIHDLIQFEILKTGFYEPEVWAALAQYAVSEEVVWDVGANIGSISFLAALDPRVREVHSFEPSPQVFLELEKNCHLNPDLKVFPHPVALDERPQIRQLFLGLRKNGGVGGFHPTWNSQSVPVRCVTGEEWVAQGLAPAPTLLKIDVEGAEEAVLRGLEPMLRSRPPKAIILEGHRENPTARFSPRLQEYLESLGFQCRLLEGAGDRLTVNFLAVPK